MLQNKSYNFLCPMYIFNKKIMDTWFGHLNSLEEFWNKSSIIDIVSLTYDLELS